MRDQLSVRLPHELNAAVGARAKREARRPSDIVRLALQAYLKGSLNDGRRGTDRVRETTAAPAWGESESPDSERTIVLRDVPPELYQALEVRAASERLSVADYVLDILARRQFRERLQSRRRVELSVPAADLIREGRDSR
jgi:plasmid stability protein